MTDAILQQLAAAYGTPTFVFDVDALQARVTASQRMAAASISPNSTRWPMCLI